MTVAGRPTSEQYGPTHPPCRFNCCRADCSCCCTVGAGSWASRCRHVSLITVRVGSAVNSCRSCSSCSSSRSSTKTPSNQQCRHKWVAGLRKGNAVAAGVSVHCHFEKGSTANQWENGRETHASHERHIKSTASATSKPSCMHCEHAKRITKPAFNVRPLVNLLVQVTFACVLGVTTIHAIPVLPHTKC